MKRILVPIDFSISSTNAAYYAADFGYHINAEIILLYVHDVQLLAINPQILGTLHDQSEHNCKNALNNLRSEIMQKHDNKIIVSMELITGFVINNIEDYAKKKQVDLIVMGMQGTNYIEERFLGSTTTMLMHKITIPVLSIDKHVVYRPIKKIIFATDGLPANYTQIPKTLIRFMENFKSHVYVLHVAPGLVTNIAGEETGFEEINEEFKGLDYSFHFHSSNDVIGDINAFVNEKGADMVVMMPRNHTIWGGILKESSTKRMAFHSKVPLLALHE